MYTYNRVRAVRFPIEEGIDCDNELLSIFLRNNFMLCLISISIYKFFICLKIRITEHICLHLCN